ncbi:MAG: TnpV protein [Clostridia bacterium]|nr:TnpV protein [Clostridia bacterium]
MKLEYQKVGDYYLPLLSYPAAARPIGHWGRMRCDYLKEHQPVYFNQLVLSGRFYIELAELDRQAQERYELIIEQMKIAEGVTEALKARDQMAWVGRMNNIAARAREIVREEMIFT